MDDRIGRRVLIEDEVGRAIEQGPTHGVGYSLQSVVDGGSWVIVQLADKHTAARAIDHDMASADAPRRAGIVE